MRATPDAAPMIVTVRSMRGSQIVSRSDKSIVVKRGQAAADSGDRARPLDSAWDHSTHESFYAYYAEESASEEALVRFRRIRDHILRIIAKGKPLDRKLEVVDIGCGAGTQSMVWAESGHRVHALDINEPLVELGRQRAAGAGHSIDFRVGSATALPWSDESMEVCIANELLEHVADWETCLKEFTRILRPGGALFFTTTNWLCPIQAEFNLPLYSWYPAPVKHYFENMALTKRPEIANFARYPAVNWFTFYGLRKWLSSRGFHCLDRFDIMDLEEKRAWARLTASAVRSVPLLRGLAHICTSGTIILAIRAGDAA